MKFNIYQIADNEYIASNEKLDERFNTKVGEVKMRQKMNIRWGTEQEIFIRDSESAIRAYKQGYKSFTV